MKPINIPWNKPSIGKEEFKRVQSVFKSNWFMQGKITETFEDLLSKYTNSNVVVVNNGSSALMATMMAKGLKPGDKVVVPSFTFVATSSVPKILGAKVIPVDIDSKTLNTTPENVEKIVKKHDIKMVIVADIAGSSVDIDAFYDLSKRYRFMLIEDAAQSFGGEYKNKKIGSFLHPTTFSFQTTKQLTTIEGGCIATKDKSIIKKIKKIRDHGRKSKGSYLFDEIGTNFRTNELQSAIGISQLNKIEKFIEKRIRIATLYRKNITNLSFQEIPIHVTRHPYMMFFAFAKDKKTRNKLVKFLNKNGIGARLPWAPIHLQPCNSEMHKIKNEKSEFVFNTSLILPMYNNMTIKDAKFVIKHIENFK